MRIAIVAPGGVGGYFGGLLAKAGEDVAALARGTHLAAIKQHGLRIEGTPGDDIVRFDTSDDAMQIGVADIVVFAVKLYQIEDAARAAAPLFGPETLAISLLKRLGVPTPHHAALYACSSRTPAGWQHSHDALGIIFTGLAPQLTTGSSPTQYKTLFRALAFCHR